MTPVRWLFMLPGMVWLGIFLVLPAVLILIMSFYERGLYGGVDWNFTLENFSRAAAPVFLQILATSVEIAGVTTLLCVLIGYPVALAVALAPPRQQAVFLVLIILPFLSNYLIRTYAWMVILQADGIVNSVLTTIGLVDAPLKLLYNKWAVVLGFVYASLPFMILSIYSALSRIDPSLFEASTDLGASPFNTFRRVTLPLSLAGAAAGSVFVFVLSIGNFITPQLLGGGKILMIGNAISDQFLTARDWPFGSALSLYLLAMMLVLLIGQAYLSRRGSGGI